MKTNSKQQTVAPGVAAAEEVKAQNAPMSVKAVREFVQQDLKRLENMIVAWQDPRMMDMLAEYFYSKWHNKENAKVKNINQVEMFDKVTEANI